MVKIFAVNAWTLSGLNLCMPCESCQHLCKLICTSVLWTLEDTVSLESPIMSSSYSFFMPLCLHSPLNSEGSIRWGHSISDLVLQVSCCLHCVQLQISVLVLIYCKRKLLWGWLSQVLISVCKGMSFIAVPLAEQQYLVSPGPIICLRFMFLAPQEYQAWVASHGGGRT